MIVDMKLGVGIETLVSSIDDIVACDAYQATDRYYRDDQML